MTRARRRKKAEDRQRELAEKDERLSDSPPRAAEAENYADAISAVSFPASNLPSFTRKWRRSERCVTQRPCVEDYSAASVTTAFS